MNIVIATIGSRGDLQPYIALGLELKKAGHHVIVASHPGMGELVRFYNLPFASIGPDVDYSIEVPKMRGNGKNWLAGFMRVMKFSFRIIALAHEDTLAICRGADLVVTSHSAAGSMEVEQLNLPWVSVTLQPQAIPDRNPHKPRLQKIMESIAGPIIGFMMTRPLNQVRKKSGLPSMGPNGVTSPHLNLIPISPVTYPPSPYWENRHQVTGYLFTPEPEGWLPPQDLTAFLENGDAPIVVSLGTMSLGEADAMETAEIVVKAVKQAGVRAVIQGWQKQLGKMDLPPTIYSAGSLPHEWLLAQAVGVVHHGGFGTTAAGFRAGIPAVVIPHMIDQFIWGQQVNQLGVGPRPIGRNNLNSDKLAQGLVQITTDFQMRRKAFALGEKIRLERGVENAVKLIHEKFPA